MTKEETLAKIETVLPKLEQWIKFKNVALDAVERETVKELAGIVASGRTFCFNCGASVGELLTIIYSYHQRESQK